MQEADGHRGDGHCELKRVISSWVSTSSRLTERTKMAEELQDAAGAVPASPLSPEAGRTVSVCGSHMDARM